MSKASIKALLGTSLLFGALTAWQLANEYYFDYQVNGTTEAMKAYTSSVTLACIFGVFSCLSFIWAATSAYYRE